MTSPEAMELLHAGGLVRRLEWLRAYPIFGPMAPWMKGYWGDSPEPPPEEAALMWYLLPEECRAGEIGSAWEDDTYKPTQRDRDASDWIDVDAEPTRKPVTPDQHEIEMVAHIIDPHPFLRTKAYLPRQDPYRIRTALAKATRIVQAINAVRGKIEP